MLLAIDLGNTNVTLGIFDDNELLGTFRMTTKIPRTSDEYGIYICNLIERRNLRVTDIDSVIIASVVPDVMHSLTSGIVKYFHVNPVAVGPGIKTGIKIVAANPKEVGADRIADCVAAYEIYGGPVIVVDFGTATTYDLILADGSFTAGVTAPGIRTSAKALWTEAAKLPEFEIKKPDTILARETITSMQAGSVYGTIGQTEYIIKKIQEEAGIDRIKVVATGGLGKIIADETDAIDIYDPMLTLHGLMLIYNKCKGR